MLRQKPILKYNGLTVVLSNPSRFDKLRLLSGNGGIFFNNECLQPETNTMQCDVRLAADDSPFLSGTVCVLVLGDDAAAKYIGAEHTLGQIRGAPYNRDGLIFVASFSPQDAVDLVDWESAARDEDTGEEKDEFVDDKSHHGRTARRNYGFWLRRDTKRCLEIIKNGLPERKSAEYIVRPPQQEIHDFMRSCKDTDVFFDIETDRLLHITCFAIATKDSPVFTVPLLDHNYNRAYDDIPQILADLSYVSNHNCLVAHNGAGFDFLVLPFKYGIPIGNNLYDTMLAHHRCFPLVEKSLGHCTSLWTYEPFHKDESDFSYNSPEACYRLWSYCGKDVHTMRLIKSAIDTAAQRTPGLTDSIRRANASIRPYIIMMLQGIHFKQEIMNDVIAENDRLMMHYAKWIPMLIGKDAMPYVSGQSKHSMCGSSQQCVRYFHDLMNYPVVSRSDRTGEPSLGKAQLLKLRLKHENPIIDICLNYRRLSKETGMLKFTPWKSADAEKELPLFSRSDTSESQD